MPKLGIDDSNPASANGVPWSSSSAGIRKATPLMKVNALAVTRSETTTIDQRRPVLTPTVPLGSVGIDPCSHSHVVAGAEAATGPAVRTSVGAHYAKANAPWSNCQSRWRRVRLHRGRTRRDDRPRDRRASVRQPDFHGSLLAAGRRATAGTDPGQQGGLHWQELRRSHHRDGRRATGRSGDLPQSQHGDGRTECAYSVSGQRIAVAFRGRAGGGDQSAL